MARAATAMMKIRLIVAGRMLTATPDDNPAARDCVGRLLLTIVQKDYARTEKHACLAGKPTDEDAPAGIARSVGDITTPHPGEILRCSRRIFATRKA